MTTYYYHFEIWKDEKVELKSFELYDNLNDLMDEVDKVIYQYTGEEGKPDRYYTARSMTPCDSVLYYKAASGHEFYISMMRFVSNYKKSSNYTTENIGGGIIVFHKP